MRIYEISLIGKMRIAEQVIRFVQQDLVYMMAAFKRFLLLVQVKGGVDVQKTDKFLQTFIATKLSVIEIVRTANDYRQYVVLEQHSADLTYANISPTQVNPHIKIAKIYYSVRTQSFF